MNCKYCGGEMKKWKDHGYKDDSGNFRAYKYDENGRHAQEIHTEHHEAGWSCTGCPASFHTDESWHHPQEWVEVQ